MTSHTPGPWNFTAHQGCWVICSGAPETPNPLGPLAIMGKNGDFCSKDYYAWVSRNVADWHLIAAAPDLLEALKYYMSQFGQAFCAHGIPLGPHQIEADRMARAAIAKAEGRSNE